MPNRPAPISDLARMYQQRIPTAPKSIGRLGPVTIGGGGLSLNPMPALRSAGGFFKRAVESLDPRVLAEQGGRSVEHVYGDARELAKSVVTGEDTLSQSPSARAYQAAGGGLAGTLNAALPYVDVATAIVPTTKVFTPAGRVALAADAAESVASRQLGQAISQATPMVRQATADATERLAQKMATNNLGRPIVAPQPMTFDEWLSQGSTLAESVRGQQWEPSEGIGYFWGGQPEINDTLRGLIPDSAWQTEAQNARQIFDVAPALSRPATVYRGITVPGPEEGTDAFADFVRSWRVGDVVEEPGLMSTSFNRDFARDASMSGTVLEIEVPAGTRALSPDMFGLGLNEQELTLPPGTKLQITGIEGNSIKAKVVPSATPTTRRQIGQDQLVRYQNVTSADATERLAQSMATPTLADRPTIYMNPFVYDPTPSQAPQPTIGINEIDDILSDIRASRPEAPSTQLAGAVERTSSNLPRGVYAVDSPSGNVTLYQLDDDGIVKGKLVMNRGNYGYVVSSLSADPGSVTAANLLAAAKITGDLNFPGVQYPLTPSTNLSQFSRPLVQKLQAAGLVDPNYNLPEPKLLNTIDRPFEIEYPIPVQDIPRLVGVPPQQLRDTTRELIQALAKAKREGRISPDTIERTAQLRAELAARQARIASQQGQVRSAFTQSISPPTATTPERAIEVLGPEGPDVLRRLAEQDRSQIVSDWMSYSSPEEFLLRPLEELSSPDLSEVAKIQKIDDLTLTLARRLQINDPISYRFDDPEEFNVFTENIQFDLADTWRRYGGERGRQLAELIDPDGG